jgi:hypothetical protein
VIGGLGGGGVFECLLREGGRLPFRYRHQSIVK